MSAEPLPLGVNHAAIVERLLDPLAYPERPKSVRLVETHISQVFLTDDFVYKLKKPVRFDFLDFSTLAARERACRDELQLNRRLAPDVYLSVLPVTCDDSGKPALDGQGRVVDWVVRMRRLPQERMLDELIGTGRLTAADTARLAEHLSRHYAKAPPLTVRPDEFHAGLLSHVRDNLATLLGCDDLDESLVRRIHTTQLRLLKSGEAQFAARVLDGRIIDGHGDLRPEHVCLTSPPAVFDCVEFNADFRRVDVLDELCFLAMECDALNAADVGERILAAYLAASHDRPPPNLLPFYKSYRACVRAKVAALRAAQLAKPDGNARPSPADRYLSLADAYLRNAGARPLLLVVAGLMGTGKSTLARVVADELSLKILRTDVIRSTLIPPEGAADGFGEGRYRPGVRALVYEEMFRQAADELRSGGSLILDATFTEAARREQAKRLAHDCNADVLVVECVCPSDVAVARIESRLRQGDDASEARSELYEQQAAERRQEGSAAIDLTIDTTNAAPMQADQVFRALPLPIPVRRENPPTAE